MKKDGIKSKFPLGVVAIIILIFAFLFLINYNFSGANTSDNSDEYQITKLDILATVNENNSIDIIETYNVDFYVSSHGIYRTLNKYEQISYIDNGNPKYERYEISLSNIDCSTYYSVSENSNGYYIKIGDPKSYASNQESYTLSYTINLGDDKITSFDQLYYNFVGTGWDTKISNISLSVKFEKTITDREIYIYIGTENEDITETIMINNNQFYYQYDGTLPAHKGLTVRTILDEGYFETIKQSHLTDYLLLGISVAIVLIATAIFFTQNNKSKVIPIVEFSAPNGITPADAGYIIDKKIDRGEISAIIVYWASKGYLQIKESEGKTILIKIKDADDNMKGYEKAIFNTMFSGDKKEYDISSENIKVAQEINNAKAPITAENEKFFSKKISTLKILFTAVFSILFAIITYFTSRQVLLIEIGVLDSILIGTGVFLGAYLIYYAFSRKLTMRAFSFFMTLFFGILVLLTAYITIAYFTFNPYSNPLFNTITLPMLLSTLLLFAILFNERVEGKNKEIGKILGLRKFILLTEKDRIKKLANENPSLFYDILPFAYVLGISGQWIDKFKDIELSTPSWYLSDQNIVSIYIGMRLLTSINTLNFVMVKLLGTTLGKIIVAGKVIGSIGGGFGKGGGRSGGGLGGGGGGRW